MNFILKLVVKSHIWLACIAGLLICETYFKFNLEVDSTYLILIFSSIIIAYNTHSLIGYFTNRLSFEYMNWFKAHRIWVYCISALAGAVLCFTLYNKIDFILSYELILILIFYLVHQLIVSSGRSNFLSSVLKFSINVFSWVLITTVLPVLLSHVEWTNSMYLFILFRFVLYLTLFLLFEYRDITHDTNIHKQNILHYISLNMFRFLYYFLLIIGFLFLLIHPKSIVYIDIVVTFVLLYLFYQFKNITTYYHTMLFWDGVLIVLPLSTLYLTN